MGLSAEMWGTRLFGKSADLLPSNNTESFGVGVN